MIARIRDRDTFVRLRREGVRLRTDPLWCAYVHDATTTRPQVGFAIGRSVGNAVTRNRLRRRLRSILSGLDVPGGVLLIGVTPRVAELTFDQLTLRTAALLERVRAAARTAEDVARPRGVHAGTP